MVNWKRFRNDWRLINFYEMKYQQSLLYFTSHVIKTNFHFNFQIYKLILIKAFLNKIYLCFVWWKPYLGGLYNNSWKQSLQQLGIIIWCIQIFFKKSHGVSILFLLIKLFKLWKYWIVKHRLQPNLIKFASKQKQALRTTPMSTLESESRSEQKMKELFILKFIS